MASSSTSAYSAVVGASNVQPDVRTTPMSRPGFGRIGRQVQLNTNYFPLTLTQRLSSVWEYDVQLFAMRKQNPQDPHNSTEISTNIVSKSPIFFNRAVFAYWCAKFLPHPSLPYDGRSIAYAPYQIDKNHLHDEDDHGYKIRVNKEGPFEDDATETDEHVWLKIKMVAVINANALRNRSVSVFQAAPCLAAIDAVLACRPLQSYVQVGRSFYTPQGRSDLGGGVESWRGFYQSARLSLMGPILNMDESRTPFWSHGGKPLIDLVNEITENGRRFDFRDSGLARLLTGLKLKATHNNISYRFQGFTRYPPEEMMFLDQNQQRVSVQSYFLTRYNVHVGNVYPCVITNKTKNTMVPIDCLIVSSKQRLTKAMTPQQTTNMIRGAATRPLERMNSTLRSINQINHTDEATCRAFGIQVSKQNVQVRARILPAPSIKFDGDTLENPIRGSWNGSNIRKLIKCCPLNSWGILDHCRLGEGQTQRFIRSLTESARRMGIQVQRCGRIYRSGNQSIERSMDTLCNQFRGGSLQLLIIFVNRPSSQVYNKIKLHGDTRLGIITQVVLRKNLNLKRGFCENLLLKINAKLGGSNFYPEPNRNVPLVSAINSNTTIVLGADVTHPSGGENRPSVAALVCSLDEKGCQFTGAIRNQRGREEIIQDIGNMFKEVYERWMQATNHAVPCKSIIMFRDGVSEGQFALVMDSEVEAIRRACQSYHRNFNPKITYIIVTKRHHARFFPVGREGDKNNNMLAGTVIDTQIVSSNFYDFYLNSHAGIQGTSRPSKYTVLIDENNIPVDALQLYIYRLAHAYARCNRSVSMVNSAYYAHLLAFRGRAYLGDSSDGAQGQIEETAKPASSIADRLFFI